MCQLEIEARERVLRAVPRVGSYSAISLLQGIHLTVLISNTETSTQVSSDNRCVRSDAGCMFEAFVRVDMNKI